MTRDEARTFQRLLIAAGYDVGRWGADGYIGDATRAAVRLYQQARGIAVTGELDAATIALLSGEVPAAGRPTTIPEDWMPLVPMNGIVVHWTGGTHNASGDDRKHYHVLIEGSAKLVRGTPSIALNPRSGVKKGYAAHTRGLNSGWIGVSLCCMGGATERPFSSGKYPMTRGQWDMLPYALADLCRWYKIPVGPRTVLSHAEVQRTLGKPQSGKWDISRLSFDPSIVGATACGDIMRASTSSLLAR